MGVQKNSIAYKALPEDMKLLLEEGVIDADGQPKYHSEIFEDVLFAELKSKLVARAKAVKAEREAEEAAQA